jgi:hypothetical protein
VGLIHSAVEGTETTRNRNIVNAALNWRFVAFLRRLRGSDRAIVRSARQIPSPSLTDAGGEKQYAPNPSAESGRNSPCDGGNPRECRGFTRWSTEWLQARYRQEVPDVAERSTEISLRRVPLAFPGLRPMALTRLPAGCRESGCSRVPYSRSRWSEVETPESTSTAGPGMSKDNFMRDGRARLFTVQAKEPGYTTRSLSFRSPSGSTCAMPRLLRSCPRLR